MGAEIGQSASKITPFSFPLILCMPFLDCGVSCILRFKFDKTSLPPVGSEMMERKELASSLNRGAF